MQAGAREQPVEAARRAEREAQRLVVVARVRVELDGRVPERPDRLHPLGGVPDVGSDGVARPRNPAELRDRARLVGQEVQWQARDHDLHAGHGRAAAGGVDRHRTHDEAAATEGRAADRHPVLGVRAVVDRPADQAAALRVQPHAGAARELLDCDRDRAGLSGNAVWSSVGGRRDGRREQAEQDRGASPTRISS